MIRPTLVFFLALVLQLGAAVEECDDNSIGKTLQDPEDCHGYYLCHSGHKLQQYCAPGMKYEAQLGTCRVGKCPPCNCAVDPTPTTTPEPTDSSTDSSTSDSTTTPLPTESSTDQSTTTSEPTESSTDSSTADPTTTTPEPTESTTDSSTSDPTTTTPEPTESTTDSSTAASTTTPEPTESTTTPQPSESTSTTEDPTTTTTESVPRPPVSCEGIPDGAFFRDPVHCRDYYVCRNRKPVLLHCQKGMWFDDINFVCNFPSLVNCPANID